MRNNIGQQSSEEEGEDGDEDGEEEADDDPGNGSITLGREDLQIIHMVEQKLSYHQSML